MLFPAYKGDGAYVFVCYAHEDEAAVFPDIQRLHDQGTNIWYDEGISAGRVWRAEIARSIQGASRFLYFISKASLSSPHCAREVEYALSQEIPVVPVYLDDSKLTPELDLVFSRVHALHRTQDERYQQHLFESLTGQSDAEASFTPSPETRSRPWRFVSGLAVLVLLLGGIWYVQQSIRSTAAIDPNSIAVLPLLNIDGSDQTAIFSKGLMEDVIDRLTRVPGLRVSSRGDSASLPVNASSEDVRQRLRVSYYIQGSVQLTDERIRVVIQLIESSEGRQLQSRSFDRERGDFFEIQDEITELAIANLRVALPEDVQAALGTRDSIAANIDAYVLYRRGIEELRKPMTSQTAEQALDWFAQSLKIDPAYAAAHAGVCLAHTARFNFVGDTSFIVEAETACAAALELNPNLTIVHNALGDLYWETGRQEEAEQWYLQTLEINPNDALALAGLAQVYSGRQDWAKAEESIRQVIAIRPGNWESYNELGIFLYQNGRYDEAATAFGEVVSLDPDNVQGLSNLATSIMLSGNFEEAAPVYARTIEVEPHATVYTNLGLMHYYLGDFDSAIEAHRNATRLGPSDHLTWLNLGDALSFSNETSRGEQAYARAERLAEIRLELNHLDFETMMDLAWAKAMLGNLDEAQELLDRASSIAPGDPYVHYIRGLVLTRQGAQTSALDELEMAVDMGYPLVMLAAEPHLHSLTDHPRFGALTQRHGSN